MEDIKCRHTHFDPVHSNFADDAIEVFLDLIDMCEESFGSCVSLPEYVHMTIHNIRDIT